MSRTDRAIGIALGLVIGVVALILFIFLGSEGAIDAPSLDTRRRAAACARGPGAVSLRTIRLAAVLMPAALLLHEGAYALHGGGSLAGAHGYLELGLPLVVALAASLALASLILPALGEGASEPSPRAPLLLTAALLAIFAGQELVEAAILGGGVDGLLASLAVAWLAPPLALLLGALASALVLTLERAGETLARLTRPSARRRRRAGSAAAPASASVATLACAGLRFGFSRRPPPLRSGFIA